MNMTTNFVWNIFFCKSNMVKMHTFKIIPRSVLWALQWFNHIGT